MASSLWASGFPSVMDLLHPFSHVVMGMKGAWCWHSLGWSWGSQVIRYNPAYEVFPGREEAAPRNE